MVNKKQTVATELKPTTKKCSFMTLSGPGERESQGLEEATQPVRADGADAGRWQGQVGLL